MADQPHDISLAMVMNYMQSMEQRIMSRIDGLETKVDRLGEKVDRLEAKVDRNHTQNMNALDNIDARLDDLEVVQVPAIRKVVGMQ